MRILLSLAIAAAAHACTLIDGPDITGRDLAVANPAFAYLDPESIVAPSPIPGVKRLMKVSNEELCFERKTRILTRDDLLPVLESALRTAAVSPREASASPLNITILDFTRTPIPTGILEFRRAGLDNNGLWRGHVKYDGNHTISLWVKVRVTTEQTWIEALQPLPPGKPIEVAQVASRTGPRSPFGPAPIGAVDLAAGRIPLRAIKPGEPIFPAMLSTPHDVERGETVRVDVASGEAKISFDAVAQSSGRVGETVLIRNPENGRYFQARVDARGKVNISK